MDYSQEQERRDHLNQALKQSQLSEHLADEQSRAGPTDFWSVLEVQRDFCTNEDQMV